MNRYCSSFLIASFVYSTLLGSIFYASTINPLTKSIKNEPKKDQKVRVSLLAPPKPKVIEKSNKHIQTKNKQKLKREYFALLQEKINKNKNYPKRARMRNIEDDIKVEFKISPKGELISFNIIEGKKIFYRSTKKAIEDCFPFTPPIGVLSKVTTIKLTLAYRLF